MEMKVEIIGKETVKPSFPTPSDHKKFKLSMADVFGPNAYVSVILFFDTICKDHDPHGPTISKRSEKLKKSLSNTLTLFYPFAGRIEEDGLSIECSDEGALYVESQVLCFLYDILKQPEPMFLKDLIPTDDVGVGSDWPLVLVQANFFECGKLAIGICVSHKICDAASLATFIKTWADITIGDGGGGGDDCGGNGVGGGYGNGGDVGGGDDVGGGGDGVGGDVGVSAGADDEKGVLAPDFTSASSFFPQVESLIKLLPEMKAFKKEKCVSKRYVFDAPKISLLKTQASATSSQLPTRVEVVTALIWKSATKASRSNSVSSHSSLLVQAVNLRSRVKPRLSEKSIGNLIAHFTVENKLSIIELDLETAIDGQRKAVQKLYETYTKISKGEMASSELFKWWNEAFFTKVEGRVVYNFSSWSKFGLYETDFGSGKPIWVSYKANLTIKNLFVLMDTRDGNGIEAWITLSEQDMALFEKDKDVLAFAILNPSAL